VVFVHTLKNMHSLAVASAAASAASRVGTSGRKRLLASGISWSGLPDKKYNYSPDAAGKEIIVSFDAFHVFKLLTKC
jgi:hypothetical protein